MSNGGSDGKQDQQGGVLSNAPFVIVLVALLSLLLPHASVPTDNRATSSTTSAPPAPACGDTELPIADRIESMLTDAAGGTSESKREPTLAAPDTRAASDTPALTASVSIQIKELWMRATFVMWSDMIKGFSSRMLGLEIPRFLIVTVHDPVDTHLQTYFDADFAVLQRAIQKHNFIVQQYWLPWQQWLHDPRSEDTTKRFKRLYEREPGILVCRRDSQWGPQLLIILLVGETPTGGVHPEAFQEALDMASQYEPSIRVVGPGASGTCASVRQGLVAWHKRQEVNFSTIVDVELISGSATSENALAQLNFEQPNKGSTLISKVHTTVLPDSVAISQMFNHLVNERHIDASRIALLQEADTLYGQQAIQRDNLKRLRIDDILVLPYPMEIGTVRNEYEKVRALKFGPQEPTTVPRMNLEVPWIEPPYARDRLPQFSDATPAATERRMSMMLSAIAQRDICAVGLLGTDPKDLLYLAQQIRRFCPNVQLFTFESNVLFTHPDYAALFKGTIVASTYPTFMNNQEWCRISLPRLTTQFPTSLSQGVFNAALAQLEQMYPEDGQAHTGKNGIASGDNSWPPLVEYSKPFDPSSYGSPPLWLSIIGQNGVAPVRAIWPVPDLKSELLYKPIRRPEATPVFTRSVSDNTMPDSVEHPRGAALANLFLGLPPLTFPSIIVNITVLVIAIAFLLENLGWKPARKLQRRYSPASVSWLRLDAIRQRPPSDLSSQYVADNWSYFYAFVLFVFLTAVQLIANTINRKVGSLPHGLYDRHWPYHAARGLAFVALGVLLFTIYCILLRWLQFSDGVLQRIRHRWSARAVIAMIIAASAFLTYGTWYSGDDLETAIKVERWGYLLDGVTPLFPLACLALIPAAWAMCQLRRRYLSKIHRLGQPFPETDRPGLATRLSELDMKLIQPWWIPTEIRDWILLVGIVWFGIGLCYRWIQTADAPYFDRQLLVLGIISLALIYTLHVRFMAASGLLERLLRRVAQTPLSESFKEVPPRLKSKAAGQIFAASPHPGDLQIVILELQALVDKSPFFKNQLQDLCSEAQRRFEALDKTHRANKTFVAKWMDSVNEPLRNSCRLIIHHLSRLTGFRTNEPAQAQDLRAIFNVSDRQLVPARKFVATQVTTLIRQTFAQIQNLLIFLTLMLLLFISAVYSYPFQPQRYLSLCIMGLVFWMVGTTVITFIRLNRNEVLSNLSNTTANQFTPDRALVRQLLVFGIVPLLSLLAFQFPEIGNALFFWVDGLQRALH